MQRQTTYNLKQLSLFMLVAFSLFWSCQNEATTSQKEEEEVPLPNTVEGVAEKWLNDYYGDQFAEAKRLSTDKTKEMIDTISALVLSETIAFTISDIKCNAVQDSAECSYQFQEEDFRSEEYLTLLKQNGQWLVDLGLEDDDELMEGELERMFEMSEEALEKILQQR